jgi:uncharacterized membrane protein YbhN (UPF0104 family)
VAARIAVGLTVVVATGLIVGTAPFLKGLAAVSPAALLVAAGLGIVSTTAAAWRWRAVAASLGLPLPAAVAVGAYYRSQFLNTMLPGGILGDVHRAYRHGSTSARRAPAVRAVAVERAAGQIVQAALTVAVILPLGLLSIVWPTAAGAGIAVVAVAVVIAVPRWRRALGRELAALRPVFSAPRTVFAVVVSSVLVVAAHVATFAVAALAVGVRAAPGEMAAVGLVVLAGSAIPVGIGGWGPREAVSASAFAVAGLGTGMGLAASTAFGVMSMVAVSPGALILVADCVRRLPIRRSRTRRRLASCPDPM